MSNPTSRRHALLQLGGLSTAALALAATSTGAVAAAGTDALLLNCIDYRLVSRVTRYMTARGLDQRYDQIVLAGAALAATFPGVPAWNQTFWDHVQVALDLHGISRLMVMDHRDCGAFKVFLGQDYGADPVAETSVHAYYLDLLRQQINARFPQLGVELLLMSLDGSVANLT
ncbi:MAG: hypothetical protein JO057_07450 [Chloroflexi bacterium]|nr:hypothetical protein [Chloroflexota bacterium]